MLFVGLVSLGLTSTAHAQFTANFQTNIIGGIVSNWTGNYVVGSNTFADVLSITDGGVLSNDLSIIGYEASSSNNIVRVTDAIWRDRFTLLVGLAGSGNSLEIRNGGRVISTPGVFNGSGYIGLYSNSANNSVLVTGISAIWTNSSDLWIGAGGTSNSLAIAGGGHVVNVNGYIGHPYGGPGPGTNSNFNSVVVADTGSVWTIQSGLYVGYLGNGNSLIVSNGAQVYAEVSNIGFWGGDSNNTVLVTGASSLLSNTGSFSVGTQGYGNSLVVSNGGRVADSRGYIGFTTVATNNSAIVTGSGSVWSNLLDLVVGVGVGSRLEIRDGGLVVNRQGKVGGDQMILSIARSNSVLVTGTGSVWSNTDGVAIGSGASSNSMTITGGGQVFSAWGVVGAYNTRGNSVLVTDANSLWRNTGTISVGDAGASDSTLVISNSAKVMCDVNSTLNYSGCGKSGGTNNSVRVVAGGVLEAGLTFHIGSPSVAGGLSNNLVVAGGSVSVSNLFVACGNFIQLTSGSINVTNASGTAVLEVQGKLIQNGGILRADRLVMTNGCGLFIHNDGAVQIGSYVLDPNGDADGDGMPNGWELTYGFNPFRPKDAFSDDDGDGCDNPCEFLAGSNPVADIKSITKQGDDIRVTWKAAFGKTNALQRAVDPAGPYADIFIVTNYNGAVTNYLDAGAATNFPTGIYHIRVVP